MSEKYQIKGPEGEVLGVHFQTITNTVLMVGSKSKFKPFLEHIIFDVMKFRKKDVTEEGIRQKHKYRYYLDVSEADFRRKWYLVLDKYGVTKIDSIIKIS